MKLYSSFKDLSLKDNSLLNFLNCQKPYYAHTHPYKENETLEQHITTVRKCFFSLINAHSLEGLIDGIIAKVSFGDYYIGDYLKLLFYHSIIFHDFGKLNPNFQAQKMDNDLFEFNDEIKIGTQHSILSSYIFLNYHLNKIQTEKLSSICRNILWCYAFLLQLPILNHHSSFISNGFDFNENKIASIHHVLSIFSKDEYSIKYFQQFVKAKDRLWIYFDEMAGKNGLDYFALFLLLKLNYSLLTASDYYGTAEFINGLSYQSKQDYGIITNELKNQLFNNFDNNPYKPFNVELLNHASVYNFKSIDDYKEKSKANLNVLRQMLGAKVLINIEKYEHERVFYIEAPTGGGKTNMSMIAIRKLLELRSDITKVYYVFPFTTLITQTVKAVQETFGLRDYEVAQVHSKAGVQAKNTNIEIDADYGNDNKNRIDNVFINYPFTLLTHIKFFNVLKSNNKSSNYILHRLANSIVIIDELQSYSPLEWDKIKYYISRYSELLNIRFILMSATLPKIDEIFIKDLKVSPFKNLIDNVKEYFQNPNFCERVSIKTDLLEIGEMDLDLLAKVLIKKSSDYAIGRNDEFAGGVYTVIEFIYKRTASEFYSVIKNGENFFDEIFVLSGTIIEPRRRYIIEYLKDRKTKNNKVLLITTQVVEAGVDIDMDIGFKNQSLIDSDEQLAGRINRNASKSNCELWLFKFDAPQSIYGRDLRYKVSRNFTAEFISNILIQKDFRRLYNRVFEEINMYNNSIINIASFSEYFNNFKKLDFAHIDRDFQLIDADTQSIFVPLNLPINSYKSEPNFSKQEIDLLYQFDCILDEDMSISGEAVWSLYVMLIQNKSIMFRDKKERFRILNSIMSKFVFSIYTRKIDQLLSYCEYNEDSKSYLYYQYYKFRVDVIGENGVYSLDGGINEDHFDKSYEFF